MEFHRIKTITPLPDKILLAEFNTRKRRGLRTHDGTIKHYDTKPLKNKLPVFAMLDYVHKLFEQVRVDTGGLGVVWNDELDLAADEIYHRRVLAQ